MERRDRQAGFSLVEILVAISVFAAISAISVALLGGALRAQDASETALGELAQINRVGALLREDIGQIVMRPARGPDGLEDDRVFALDVEGTERVRGRAGVPREILVLTRTGWANPGGLQPRSTLQRVVWVLEDGDLYRVAYAYPDAALEGMPRRQLIARGLSDVRIEALAAGAWNTRVRMSPSSEGSPAPPAAVRLSYLAPGLGAIEHVVLSPSADPR